MTKSFRPHYGPGVDSASNRNEYQEYFLGLKAAGAYCWQPYHLHVPTVLESGSLNLVELSKPAHQACNWIALPSFTLGTGRVSLGLCGAHLANWHTEIVDPQEPPKQNCNLNGNAKCYGHWLQVRCLEDPSYSEGKGRLHHYQRSLASTYQTTRRHIRDDRNIETTAVWAWKTTIMSVDNVLITSWQPQKPLQQIRKWEGPAKEADTKSQLFW
jgi:hypothetical protein